MKKYINVSLYCTKERMQPKSMFTDLGIGQSSEDFEGSAEDFDDSHYFYTHPWHKTLVHLFTSEV